MPFVGFLSCPRLFGGFFLSMLVLSKHFAVLLAAAMALLAHKIELRPTPEQAEYLAKACGSRRHCFNQLLAYFKQENIKWSKKLLIFYGSNCG